MGSVKKFSIAVIFLALFCSCSQSIQIFGLESRLLQKNKGKEQNLTLEISVTKDTLFYNKDTTSSVIAILKYRGSDFYYFATSPRTATMDFGVADPNSFIRSFYYDNEQCIIEIEPIIRNDLLLKYCNYLLRSGKSMVFKFPIDLKRIRCKKEAIFDTEHNKFGEYQVQLFYITEHGDTICSNKVNFWFLDNETN